MFVDDNENIYVNGWSGNDLVTIKYDNQGNQEWNTARVGREYEYGIKKSLAVDFQGNVFVTTAYMSDSSNWNYDFMTEKYNANGVRQWAARYDKQEWQSEIYRQNFPVSIVVDKTGNAYVTGRSLGVNGSYDIVTIKYAPDGVELWENRFLSGENQYSDVADMAIDNSGNIYVTGVLYGDKSELIILKYNSQGIQKWIKTYQESGSFYLPSLELDDWGNIYLLSNKDKKSGLGAWADVDNCVILKYNSDGMNQWVVHCSESGNPFIGSDIGVDAFGNVYVCGYTWDDFPADQFITKKYSTDGVALWTTRDENFDSYGYPRFLILDNHGNSYVAGDVRNAGSGYDVMIVKYDSQGEEKWNIHYNDPRNAGDRISKLDIDNSGNVCMAVTTSGRSWSFLKTIKFSQTGEDSVMFHSSISDYQLNQNIPNPFNKQTLIYYRLPCSSRVKFSVFNSIGQRVAYEDMGQKSSGHHAFHFMSDQLSTGIYFYRMEANDFIETRKMTVIN